MSPDLRRAEIYWRLRRNRVFARARETRTRSGSGPLRRQPRAGRAPAANRPENPPAAVFVRRRESVSFVSSMSWLTHGEFPRHFVQVIIVVQPRTSGGLDSSSFSRSCAGASDAKNCAVDFMLARSATGRQRLHA